MTRTSRYGLGACRLVARGLTLAFAAVSWRVRVSVLLLAVFSAVPSALGNPQAIRDFGVNTGEAINEGFFFYEGKYVAAPYVVERRGLDIYVNDILVSQGPEWPRYDARVDEDPGAPPSGVEKPWEPPSSGDVRDNYWSRKWRYLEQHFDHKTAVHKMKEAYAKSNIFKSVRAGDKEDLLIVTDVEGNEIGISYEQPGDRGLDAMSRQELLELCEGYKQHYEMMLKRDILLLKFESGEIYSGGKRADDAIRLLLGEGVAQEKIKKLESIGVLTPGGDEQFHSIVHNFQATEQLKSRFDNHLERKRHKKLMKDVLRLGRHVDSMQLKDPAFAKLPAMEVSAERREETPADSTGAVGPGVPLAEVRSDREATPLGRYVHIAGIVVAAAATAAVAYMLRRQLSLSRYQ